MPMGGPRRRTADRMRHLILIADDEPMMLHALAGLFADEGYRVARAADGAEALVLVGRELPDVIVSDVEMPHLDGVGFFHRLLELGHAVPFVFISGRVARVDRLPTIPFLAKPFDLEHLLRVVSVRLARF